MDQAEPTAAEIPVRVGANGRVVLPAEVRRRLDIGEGTTLTLRTEGDAIILETRASAWRRWPAMLARSGVGTTSSLADELIADRRREADDDR